MSESSLNWEAIADETIRILQGMIRLNTSNPPGNEMIAAQFAARILRTEGIEPTIVETAPNRGNCVARLRGNGNAKPLLLYSHTDVVPVEPLKWSVDPFGGEISDGYLYGRGALDMKGIGAMQLAVFLTLARQLRAGEIQALDRDVIIAFTADEETGENQGMGPLCDLHPDLLRAEYGLSEFGGFSLHIGGKCFYPVQTAEKGTAWMRMIATGQPGHASVPHNNNAVVHLAHAVQRLGSRSLPTRLTPTTRAFVSKLATGLGGAQGAGLRVLLATGMRGLGTLSSPALRDSGFINELQAITHNTCSPTGLSAGLKTNVIPSDASAVLDCRTLPGTTTESLLSELRNVLGKDSHRLKFEIDSETPPLEMPTETPLMNVINRVIKRHDPAGIPIPYMLTGATDAKHVSMLGTICYGFSPMKFAPGDRFAERVHAHDERVALSALAWGVHVLYDTVFEFCSRT